MTNHWEDETHYARALNQLGALSEKAWAASIGFEAMSDDPRVTGIWLLSRLKGHLSSFSLLINAGLVRDAEAAQRSAIEASICLSNLQARPAEFQALLRSDAASTLDGQIPIWRAVDPGLADEATAQKGDVFKARDDGRRHARLSWSALAEAAALPDLYRWYKHLSGNSVHVTGMSLVFDGAALFGFADMKAMRRRDAIASMTVIASVGLAAFAKLMGRHDLADEVEAVMRALNEAAQSSGNSSPPGSAD